MTTLKINGQMRSLDVDPNMVSHPRQSSYIRMDGWDEEAEKWFERKMEEAAA